MPKMKTKKAASKRFQVRGSGSIKRAHATKRHILTKRTTKNKRQLKLIQLITKTIQIIGKERKEILGLKIQFKGRINKRKRARSIHFKDGIITLQSHSSRVEYGYTNAYTKSGSLGVKL